MHIFLCTYICDCSLWQAFGNFFVFDRTAGRPWQTRGRREVRDVQGLFELFVAVYLIEIFSQDLCIDA